MIPKHLKISSSSPFGSSPRNTKMERVKEIQNKIRIIDNQLNNAISSFRAKHNKTPTELDLMKDSVTVPLITQRKKLVSQYKSLKDDIEYAKGLFQQIQRDDPIKNAQKSFRGIAANNPFASQKEYTDPVVRPAMTPVQRVGNNTTKTGTLWDPRFNFNDITVDPKIKRYYNRIVRGRW